MPLPQQGCCVQDCLFFHEQGGLWGLTHSVKSVRHLHGRGVFSDGPAKRFVWGRGEPSQEAVDIFDPVAETWDTFPTAHQHREQAAPAAIDGRFYRCGGYSGDPDSPSTSLKCFGPLVGIWQTLPPMSQGLSHHAVAVVGVRLYVCGGSSDGRALESAECFDTSTTLWRSHFQPCVV